MLEFVGESGATAHSSVTFAHNIHTKNLCTH